MTSITKQALLTAVEKAASGCNVTNIGCDTVDQAERVIDANLNFHDKLPLIAFAGLVHVWLSDDSVLLTAFALSGAQYETDGRIDNATFAQHKPSSPDAC